MYVGRTVISTFSWQSNERVTWSTVVPEVDWEKWKGISSRTTRGMSPWVHFIDLNLWTILFHILSEIEDYRILI